VTNDSNTQQHCYRCGAVLTGQARICPVCGRKQVRTCYCGADIPVTAETCPECGADWSASRRVRRKSQRKRFNRKKLAKFAAAGGLITLALVGLLYLAITSLAWYSLPASQSLPSSLLQRLALAATTIGSTITALASHLTQQASAIATIVVVGLIGAGVGAVIYLVREGFWRRWRRQSSGKVRRSRSSSDSDSSDQP